MPSWCSYFPPPKAITTLIRVARSIMGWKSRQSHLLRAGTTPDDQAAQAEAGTAATSDTALLHDIGKIVVDLHVEHEDGGLWYPWHGPLTRPYRFRYREDREYRLHSAAI